MGLSYLSESQNYRPEPYVTPVDLSLLSKVLTYEDQQFTQNANKIQQQIDSYASMDVVKPEDRKYLNTKMNNLVDGINNLGGVNLADPSVANQIQGLGAGIYSDQKILNAVAGTRTFRNLQGEYQNWLTNPKFKGQYSKVNESYDMAQASKWFNDGQVGSQYTGPTNATPYIDNDKMVGDVFKKIKANYTESVVQKGFYISKDGTESLSEKDLAQRARDMVLNNPQAAEQAKRNAWFLTEGMGYTGQQVVSGLINSTNNDIADTQSEIDYYSKMKDLAANDPKAYGIYNANLLKLTEYQKQLKDKVQNLAVNGEQEYNNNPTGYQMDYYVGNWSRGIGRLYQVNRTKQELKADPAAMLQETIQQRDRHDEASLAEHGLRRFYDPTINGYNYVRDESLVPLKGVKGKTDANGNPIGQDNVFEPINDVAADPEKAYRVNLDTTQADINNKNLLKESLINTFVVDSGKSDDNLSFLLTAGPKRDEWIKNIRQMYEDKANGKDVDLSKLPEGSQQLFGQLDEINHQITFQQRRLENYNNILPLTDAEKKIYSDYQANPQKYMEVNPWSNREFIGGDVVAKRPNKQIRDIESKIDSAPDYTKKTYWQQFSLRPQFYLRNYGDKDQAYLSDLKSDIVLNKSLNDSSLEGISTENMKILGIGRRNDGQEGFAEYVEILDKNGKKVTAIPKMIPITDQTAQSYLGRLPATDAVDVAQEVQFEGKSQPRVLSNPSGLAAKIIVVKLPGSGLYQAKIVTADGNRINITQPQGDPETAFEGARTIIQTYKGGDYNKFLSEAQNSKYLNNAGHSK